MSFSGDGRDQQSWRSAETAVRAIARRRLDVLQRRGEDEEDLVQEVTIQLWRRQRDTVVQNPTGLACRIAHDRLVDRQRKPAPQTVRVDIDQLNVAARDSVSDEVLEQETRCELARRIELAIESPLEREVVRLYSEGMERAEVAARLDMPVDGVRTVIQRIRRRVRRQGPEVGLDSSHTPRFPIIAVDA